MKLLLVEDQVELASSIQNYFQEDGSVCEYAGTFQTASEKLHAYQYDILILDIMLPDGNGLAILETIKKSQPDIGVIIVSAKNALDDKLKGLDLGADDYLAKPFHLAELNARIRAVFRRRLQKGQDILNFHEIQLNLETYEASVEGEVLDLTKKEFELLHYFFVNQKRLLTKQSIAEHLWGDYMDTADSFDFVYQHIKNLRKKISIAGGNDYLKTVYGVGYKMNDL
ncbi:MAG: response regulator transcription factor [Cyclobacteriaceae bacterium]